jgi:hypothetical protein
LKCRGAATEISTAILFSLIKNISLKAFRDREIQNHFWRHLSLQASTQMTELLNHIQTNPNEADKWSYVWNSDNFISKKAYHQIIGINDASPIFKWMWKSCVMGKHKFFFWLLLHNRLNTRELLKRKNMELQDYTCVLCNGSIEENLLHLLFECSFSKWCWRFVNVRWDTSLPTQDMLIRSRRQFNSSIFREVVIEMWQSLMVQQSLLVDGKRPSGMNLNLSCIEQSHLLRFF